MTTTSYTPTIYDVKTLLECLENPTLEANLAAQEQAIDWKAVCKAMSFFLIPAIDKAAPVIHPLPPKNNRIETTPFPPNMLKQEPAFTLGSMPGTVQADIDEFEKYINDRSETTGDFDRRLCGILRRIANERLSVGGIPGTPLQPLPYLPPIWPPTVCKGATTDVPGTVFCFNSMSQQADGDGLSHTD
jgi:hypothetical protein